MKLLLLFVCLLTIREGLCYERTAVYIRLVTLGAYCRQIYSLLLLCCIVALQYTAQCHGNVRLCSSENIYLCLQAVVNETSKLN